VPPPAGAGPSLAAAFDRIQAPGGPAQTRVLSDNLDAWNARWEILSAAEKSIDTTYFILERDPFGFAFLGMLLKKRMAGVDVRVMTDSVADPVGRTGFTMAMTGKDYLQEIVNHGGKAYVYHPVWHRPMDLLRGDYSPLASNHDKVLVVDGQRGITGGRNVSADYFAHPADHEGVWRDMDIALDGAGTAAGLKAAIDAEIEHGVVDEVEGDRFGNWDKKDIQLLGAAELMDLWLHDPSFTDVQKASLRADPSQLQPLADALVQRALDRVATQLKRAPSDADREFLAEQAGELVKHLEARGSAERLRATRLPERQTEVKIIDQTSAAETRIDGISPALKALVDSATRRIVIENPYVVLTEEMMVGLERAAARGVRIDIITNSPLSTDSAVTQAFFLKDWPFILARCSTARIFVATGERGFHTKSAVVDGEQSLVSTYNLDLLSGCVNGEVGAVVESKEVAADLLAAFEADLADPSYGFVEHRIKRDAHGRPVLKNGEPVVEFGPEHYLPKDVLEDYNKKSELIGDKLREYLGALEPLRHPKLS
jgi:phosphatidylserine/phosphatidylglycerophosphate/cardiolipin synthase-like enzyme